MLVCIYSLYGLLWCSAAPRLPGLPSSRFQSFAQWPAFAQSLPARNVARERGARERFCDFWVRVWIEPSLARVPEDQIHIFSRVRSLPGAERLVARGEAVPVSLSVTKGCPSAHTAPAGVTMDPQEEVRAAQDEVKQLKAQLAA